MGSEFELNVGIVKFKIELAEFAAAIKTLSGAVAGNAQLQDVRAALQAMIAEVSRSYETMTETMKPLYAIDTQQKFVDRFGDVRAELHGKRMLLQNVARTHCHVVTDKLGELNRRRHWMQNMPLVSRAYARLETVCNEWLTRDWELVRRLETFFDLLTGFVDEVDSLRAQSETDAFAVLHDGLKQIEDDVMSVSRQLSDLKVISARL